MRTRVLLGVIVAAGFAGAASVPATYSHGSYKTYEVGKWFTENMSPGTQACPALINIDSYKKLPAQYQKLLDEAKPVASEALKKAYGEADAKFIPLFKQKKLTFVRFTDAELAQFRKVGAEPVWEEWVQKREAQGLPGKDLLKLVLDTAKAAGG